MPQPAGHSAPASSPFAESTRLSSPPAQSEGSTAWMTGGPPAGMSLPAGQSAPASSPFAESKPLSSPLHIFADSKASMASAPIAEQPCPASSLLVESKPQFSPPAGPQGHLQGVLAFSADGKMLRAGLNGDAKEYSVQDRIYMMSQLRMQNLESFPGPFGGVDGHTTEVLLEYLEKMATRLDDGDAQCCTLESAAAFPESAATACRFLCCLVRANGDVQSSEFWQHFSPVLARRAQAMRRDRETSDLRKFCAKLCRGETSAALEDGCSMGLWSHTLAVSRLLAPDACDGVLLKFVEAAKLGKSEGAIVTQQDMEDPSVQALLLLYECLAKGSQPDISEKVLSGWPAFAALFSLLLPGEYRDVAVTFIENLAARLAGTGDVFAGHV
ncbi:Calcium-dependent protein kinase 28, partial [Durusdinium trenchii]